MKTLSLPWPNHLVGWIEALLSGDLLPRPLGECVGLRVSKNFLVRRTKDLTRGKTLISLPQSKTRETSECCSEPRSHYCLGVVATGEKQLQGFLSPIHLKGRTQGRIGVTYTKSLPVIPRESLGERPGYWLLDFRFEPITPVEVPSNCSRNGVKARLCNACRSPIA